MISLLAVMPLMAQKATTIDLDGFDEIKAFDQLNVTLVESNKNQAVVTGDDVDDVSIVNKDGLLKIKMDTGDFMDGNETHVKLYYNGKLSLIDANEGAEITSDDTLNTKYLNLRAQEGGKVILKVESRNLVVKAVTGGEVKVSGSTENQEIVVRTGGDYDGRKLSSNQTDVTILAGGDAIVNVKEYVEASVTAGGTIEIYGNPEKVKEDKSLGGSIILRK